MRKLLISLMAASMLVPAVAQAEDGPVTRALRERAERSSQRDDNSDNRASSSDSDRPARVESAPREARPNRIEDSRPTASDRAAGRAEREARANREAEQVEQVQVEQPVRPERVERRREDPARVSREVVRESADVRTADGNRDRDRRDWRRDRDGDRDGRDWRRDRDGDRRWDRDWRRDGRYNWTRYRHRYGSLYRLGRYYDPYGWGYRRFSTGFSLWPSYYGSSFWLNDPWHYRLPPAYGPYRWVRYYDDALLVNIYTGHIVDVVHNIFW